MIIIFTGQPGVGKTTLSNLLANVIKMNYPEKNVYQIDGDDLRKITENQNYSADGRKKNVQTAHNIAKYLQNLSSSNVIIISLINPFREDREVIKNNYETYEFYLKSDVFRKEKTFNFSEYEEPESNYTLIDTTFYDEITSLNTILDKLKF